MIKLEHKFVEFIPKELEESILYISVKFKTASHKCACGCGNRTVTPLSPTDWKLIFNGKNVSMYPSIGNWNFPCRSHYWIEENEIKWSYQMSDEEIRLGRALNKSRKQDYYEQSSVSKAVNSRSQIKEPWWKFKWLI